MADKEISELVAAQEVTATDLFVLEQNRTAKKLSGQTLRAWLGNISAEEIQKYNQANPLQIDNTLKRTNGALGVNVAPAVQQNNNLPVTSGAVYAQIFSIQQAISEVSDASEKNGSDITLMKNVIQTINEVAEQALDTARAASPRVVNGTLIFGGTSA